ncbi:MAG: hypothetical protein KF680_01000 [Cryobacterium sp.]|nr:hypothetical protein [Cryobacterium sp.]
MASAAVALDDSPIRESVSERARELQERILQLQAARPDTRSLPTHPAIAKLLPGGALRRGAVYSVQNSTTLIMALLAAPSAAGAWSGIVGVPEFGIEAARGFGIDLDRLALVPRPGDQWLAATAAIADVMGIVVTRPPQRASDSSVSRLAARLRQRGTTLIVIGAWPHSEAMLSLERADWHGIGDGHGHLAARQATVTVTSRTGQRPRSTRLWLPDASLQVRESPQQSPTPLRVTTQGSLRALHY